MALFCGRTSSSLPVWSLPKVLPSKMNNTRRTLKVSLRRAQTPSTQAAVIAKAATSLDRQLDSLEARSARLAHAQRTGQSEQDQYRAESTVLTTNIRGIERRIELLRDAAARLSNAQLEVHGSSLNDGTRLAERAQTLRENNEGRSTDSNTDDDDDSSEETDTPDNEEADTPDNDNSSGDDASAMKWRGPPRVDR